MLVHRLTRWKMSFLTHYYSSLPWVTSFCCSVLEWLCTGMALYSNGSGSVARWWNKKKIKYFQKVTTAVLILSSFVKNNPKSYKIFGQLLWKNLWPKIVQSGHSGRLQVRVPPRTYCGASFKIQNFVFKRIWLLSLIWEIWHEPWVRNDRWDGKCVWEREREYNWKERSVVRERERERERISQMLILGVCVLRTKLCR